MDAKNAKRGWEGKMLGSQIVSFYKSFQTYCCTEIQLMLWWLLIHSSTKHAKLTLISLYALTFCGSCGGCSVLSGGVVVREGWMQTTSRSQPGAPGPGLGGVIGGAQGGAQDGASGGGRVMCSGDSATSTRSRKTVRFGSDGTAANIDFSTWNLFPDVVAKVTTSGRYLPPTGSICLCLGTLQKGFLRRWTCFLKNRIHFVLTRHSCCRSRQSHQTPFAETVILSS